MEVPTIFFKAYNFFSDPGIPMERRRKIGADCHQDSTVRVELSGAELGDADLKAPLGGPWMPWIGPKGIIPMRKMRGLCH